MPHTRRNLNLVCLLLFLLAAGTGSFAVIPRVAADATGCTLQTGEPTSTPDGPRCIGETGACYECERTSGGTTLICAEYPDPEDGFLCVEAETLPGMRAQNQV